MISLSSLVRSGYIRVKIVVYVLIIKEYYLIFNFIKI